MGTISPSAGTMVESLTRREMDILSHLARKRSNPEIARLESLALSSVKWYVNQILAKLGVTNRTEAVARAIELGLIQLESQFELPVAPPRNNLPRQLSSFIGREAEIAQVASLVRVQPLVTVTGSGGVGKTRLALETASRLLTYFHNGVWLVELAPLSNPDLVPQAVMTALGMVGRSSLPPTRQLVEYLRSRHSLLLLDNCEHVLGAVKELAHELLHACPILSMLATSRELLGVEGETIYRCPSLSLPARKSCELSNGLAESEAVQLFAARAANVASWFSLTEANEDEVGQICERLDGIPLAIELAVARTRMLSLAQIAARLDDVFGLLSGGARTQLARHQTLAAMIDWSYNLLSEPERLLLQRLSVFAGSCGLEAAEAVCSDDLLPRRSILDLLGQLVDKSLVEAVPAPTGMRYRLLETIRQYAEVRLMQTGEESRLRNQHLEVFQAFSLEAEPYLIGPDLCEWREQVDAELDNLRAAMEWSLGGPVEKGLRIAAALQWYWHGRNHLIDESVSWFERLLAVEASGPGDLRRMPARRVARGKVINTAAHRKVKNGAALAREALAIFSLMGGAYRLDWAIALLWSGEMDMREVLAIFREIGDRFWITNVLWEMHEAALEEGNVPVSKIYMEESIALIREIGYIEGEASITLHLAQSESLLGNTDRALEIYHSVGGLFRKAGSPGKEYFVANHLAMLYLIQGDYGQAENYFEKVLTFYKENGIRSQLISNIDSLALVALAAGNLDRANQLVEEALRFSQQSGYEITPEIYYIQARVAILKADFPQAYACLDRINGRLLLLVQTYGNLAAAQGLIKQALVIYASLEAYPWWVNIFPPPEREACRKTLATARSSLSAEEFSAAWEQGKAMTARQALDYAIANAPIS
jgi:predicted ATPase/DNA-binding CsgD family transcriptional regulator